MTFKVHIVVFVLKALGFKCGDKDCFLDKPLALH